MKNGRPRGPRPAVVRISIGDFSIFIYGNSSDELEVYRYTGDEPEPRLSDITIVDIVSA